MDDWHYKKTEKSANQDGNGCYILIDTSKNVLESLKNAHHKNLLLCVRVRVWRGGLLSILLQCRQHSTQQQDDRQIGSDLDNHSHI
jgi:hypothetical protein